MQRLVHFIHQEFLRIVVHYFVIGFGNNFDVQSLNVLLWDILLRCFVPMGRQLLRTNFRWYVLTDSS